MPYQPNIPTGSVPFNQDYLNVQGNFSSLNSQFNEDHVPLTSTSGTPPNGYHKAIHLVPQSPPVAVPGYGEVYARTLNDGFAVAEQLWYQFVNASAVTINVPLTRNFLPVAAANGYTFLAGNIVMQWGIVTFTGSAAVLYSIPLTAAAYSIQFTQVNGASANIREWGQVFATSSTGFTIRAIQDGGGVSSSSTTFYWVAIGS